jgi:hypothetical protein
VVIRDTEFAETISALLEPATRLFATPAGLGTISVSPGDPAHPRIPCALEQCRTRLRTGSVVTITATPGVGARFVGWSDFACSNASRTCQLLMDEDRWITATFDPVSLTVVPRAFGDITVTPAGAVCLFGGADCEFHFSPGTLVTLRREHSAADPALNHWSGSCQGVDATCTLRVYRSERVVGGFVPSVISQVGVSFTVVRGGNKHGRITGHAVGGNLTLDCGTQCHRGGFFFNQRVKLEAKPNRGARLKRWSDDKTSKTRTLAVGNVTRIKAIFAKKK